MESEYLGRTCGEKLLTIDEFRSMQSMFREMPNFPKTLLDIMLKSQNIRVIHENTSSYVNRIPPEQLAVLEREFIKAKTLHATDLELLAAEMALNEKDVQAWYTDRLAAWRREQGLSDCLGAL